MKNKLFSIILIGGIVIGLGGCEEEKVRPRTKYPSTTYQDSLTYNPSGYGSPNSSQYSNLTIWGATKDAVTQQGVTVSWSYRPNNYQGGFTIRIDNNTNSLFSNTVYYNQWSSYSPGSTTSSTYDGKGQQQLTFNSGMRPSLGTTYRITITATQYSTKSTSLTMSFDNTNLWGSYGNLGTYGSGLYSGTTPYPGTSAYPGTTTSGYNPNTYNGYYNCNSLGGVGGSPYGMTVAQGSDTITGIQQPTSTMPYIPPRPVCRQNVYPSSNCLGASVGATYCNSSYYNSLSSRGCRTCGTLVRPTGSGGSYRGESEPMSMWSKLLLGAAAIGTGYLIYRSAKSDLVEEKKTANLVASSVGKPQVPYFKFDTQPIDGKTGFLIATPYKIYTGSDGASLDPDITVLLKREYINAKILTDSSAAKDSPLHQELSRIAGEIDALPYVFTETTDPFVDFKTVFSNPIITFTFALRDDQPGGLTDGTVAFYQTGSFRIVNPYHTIIANKHSPGDIFHKNNGGGAKLFYRFYANSVWPGQIATGQQMLDQHPKFDIIFGETAEAGSSSIRAFINCLGYVCAAN